MNNSSSVSGSGSNGLLLNNCVNTTKKYNFINIENKILDNKHTEVSDGWEVLKNNKEDLDLWLYSQNSYDCKKQTSPQKKMT